MGLARTNGRNSNHHQRLAAVAADLAPARSPFWVSEPGGATPCQGWWWTPAGITAPLFLGHNHITAEIALRALIDGHYKPRPPANDPSRGVCVDQP
jgi:hypothetical protein